LEIARKHSAGPVMAVVKADAYGHGLIEVGRALDGAQVAFFGVANVGEARRLADQAGVASRVYILGPTLAVERAEIVARGWTPCISTLVEAGEFDRLAREHGVRLKVHLAVDTGMGRGGFVASQVEAAMVQLEGLQNLEIEGIGSHLPSAEDDPEFTQRQFADYTAMVVKLGGADRFRWRHLSNSAGLLGYPQGVCNLCRPGLMLYGIAPLAKYQAELRTVMALRSRISLIRTLPAGHGVSYGRSVVLGRDTQVATVGIGYGDGYPRHLSGSGAAVMIRGQRCPLLGRVTMDQIMIDVSDCPGATEGDEVELFGPGISAAEVAAWAGTIAWEIFTGITSRVARVYV
jgi:alanine racemase